MLEQLFHVNIEFPGAVAIESKDIFRPFKGLDLICAMGGMAKRAGHLGSIIVRGRKRVHD